MKRLSFRLIILVILFLILSVIIAIFTSYLSITRGARERIELLQTKGVYANDVNQKGRPHLFLKDSTVRQSDLFAYLLFTDDLESPNEWLLRTEKKGELVVKGDVVVAKEDLTLIGLRENHCQKIYCYQNLLEIDKIPAIVWQSLISIEDERFFEHDGVDLYAIARAVVKNIFLLRKSQGGSTITQQLIKNLMLGSEKSFNRKWQEAILATYFESQVDKREIVTLYLNEMYWGSLEGIALYGISAASQFYFNKRVNELDPYEITILISMLKGPSIYHPLGNETLLRQRVNANFKKLNNGTVWGEAIWINYKKSVSNRNKRGLMRSLVLSMNNRPEVLSSFESFILTDAIEVVRGDAALKSRKNISAKVLVGQVLEELKDGIYSSFERSKQAAIEDEKHQIGSTIKPILYRTFFQEGYDLNSEVSLDKISIKLKNGVWSPKDHLSKEKTMSLRDAIKKSQNIPVVRVANELGFSTVEKKIQEIIKEIKTPLDEYPSQLLGSVELSLDSLYETYKSFFKLECEDELTKGESWRDLKSVLWALSNPKEGTTGRQVMPELSEMRFFGKTGTTNQGADNWYIFFDGKLMGVIWVGVESRKDDQDSNLFGATTSFQIFQNFMSRRGKRFNELDCSLIAKRGSDVYSQ